MVLSVFMFIIILLIILDAIGALKESFYLVLIFLAIALIASAWAFIIDNPFIIVIAVLAIIIMKTTKSVIFNFNILRSNKPEVTLYNVPNIIKSEKIFEKVLCNEFYDFIIKKNYIVEIEALIKFYLSKKRARKLLLQRKDVTIDENLQCLNKKLIKKTIELTSCVKSFKNDNEEQTRLFSHIILPSEQEQLLISEFCPSCICIKTKSEDVYLIIMPIAYVGVFNCKTNELNIYPISNLKIFTQKHPEKCISMESDDEFAYRVWRHSRIDGGPDLRYKNNSFTDFVYRGVLNFECMGIMATVEFSNFSKADEMKGNIDKFILLFDSDLLLNNIE